MVKSWSGLKSKLSEEGLLDHFFVEPLDQRFNKSNTSSRFPVTEADYYPLLLETHLRDVSAHLDRVLSYRREMYEMEIQAVRAGCDYALERDQSKDELDLALIRLRRRQNTDERTAQQKAAAAFGDGDAGAGLKQTALGKAARLAQDADDGDAEARLMQEMYVRNCVYRESYWLRHNEGGNAHNYKERAERLLVLLQQDKYFAEWKCKALDLGFRAIYGRPPKAVLEANASVDELVIWVRNLFEDIAIEDEAESEFELTLPLVQPISGKSLITARQWDTAMASSGTSGLLTLPFELTAAHFPGRVRLRRLALSHGVITKEMSSGFDKTAVYEAYARYRGEVTPPPQAVGSVAYKRPPITLGGITVYGAPLEYAEGPEVTNLNPVGRWTVNVRTQPTSTKDRAVVGLLHGVDGETPWQDLKLHMRLKARGAI